MSEPTNLEQEVANLRALVLDIYAELKSNAKENNQFSGVAVKTSDLMNGFQSAMAKAIKARHASENATGENIQDFIIQDLEVEFAVPLVAERGEDEPILMIPNVKSITNDSPLVKLKFKIANIPDTGK